MHGEQDEELEGTELAAEFQFSSLQKFGQEFLKKLRGKKMANALLQKVNCHITKNFFFMVIYKNTILGFEHLVM